MIIIYDFIKNIKSFDRDYSGIAGDYTTKTTGGFDLGYELNRNFGVEFGFTRFSNNHWGPGANGFNMRVQQTNNQMFDLALKGILPIDSFKIDLFGKLGIGYTTLTQTLTYSFSNAVERYNINGYSPFLAGGFSYHLTPKVSVGAQILGTTDDFHLAELATLSYHFD